MVAFGFPGSAVKPEPFYPYLQSVDPIAEASSDSTASAVFSLSLKAKELIDLNMRRAVSILSDDLVEVFSGVVGRIAYSNDIRITVEA